MQNKRGQEGMSITAIIGIILGLAVLVVLILGFTIGWDRFLPFISSNNVENIKTTCSTACATANVYDFCSLSRTLKADDLPDTKNDKGEVVKNPKGVKGSCNSFVRATEPDYTKYGIERCPSLESETACQTVIAPTAS